MKHLHIDIVSDVACPWCAIGYARLDKAKRALAGEIEFTEQWRAFELNPDDDAQPEPILPALARKYGRPEAEMQAAQAEMMGIAKSLGLNFEKMQERYTCNTFDAHRLLKWAAPQDKATFLKKALFEAYFGRAEDVSKPGVLIGCAKAAGLDADEAQRILESDEFGQAVMEEERSYQNAGVTAVPAFVVNQRYLISGAQEADTLVEAFRTMAQEMDSNPQ
ncbi:putative DsbA family dithiol-disulfide isomerase [Marinimicrobium koreense]|uniref:Putative DsbA family dithiol-disulfide isomerase n=1 Tax=Marinimicrobium koreense TaxID=306545 RepID=A0A3N1NUA5_9GAMM|nr:DsbA family oxidoreductase [Marinimicrobium koreense]ROQ18537.1 putative DsbA family dithiol-disulfide isomerase [Marinimicrobium koreense]